MITLEDLIRSNVAIHFYLPGVSPEKSKSGEWPPSEQDLPFADRLKGDYVEGDGTEGSPFRHNLAGLSARTVILYLWLHYCHNTSTEAWLTVNGIKFRGTPDGLTAEDGVLTRLRL